MDHNLNKIKLPKDSRGEQLETISKNHFCPLFDVEKFILKGEPIDNGIDFRIELKSNGNKLGFGLNFQLKSSESTSKNNDGTYSKSLETSNIEYLLNNGQPAYYGFYISQDKAIYYESLDIFISELFSKNSNWQEQPNHTLRFSKKIDVDATIGIYNLAYNRGLMLRKLNSKLAENINSPTTDKNIIIDYNGNVKTDDEIEDFIEKYGLFLNDECRWKEILSLHNKTSVGSVKSSLYNFVIGLAYTHTGNYFQALDYLRVSYNSICNLEEDLKGYLMYYYFEIQLLFGLITINEYTEKLNIASQNSSIQHYIELDSINELVVEMYNAENFEAIEFERKISIFIATENIPYRIRLLAKISLASYKAERLICYTPFVLMSGELDFLHSNFTEINKDFRDLLLEIQGTKSAFLSHYCALRHNKFLIQFDAICKSKTKSYFGNDIYEDINRSILDSYNYFLEIGHIQNQLFALTILLESYQSMELDEKVNSTITLMETYVERYSSPDLKSKIDFIKNGGTFVQYMLTTKKKIQELEDEVESKRNELIELDKIEKGNVLPSGESNTIELFPMGYFQFPKNKIGKVFKILGIEDQNLKDKLGWFFNEGIIPIINVYAVEIKHEGSLNGVLEYKSIDSYRNMHRIRKLFYENKFYRKDLKF